jgi:hypothetical protein
MSTIIEMAKAHLLNIKRAIVDLEAQKENLQKEIDKLNEYFDQGMIEIENSDESSDSKVSDK